MGTEVVIDRGGIPGPGSEVLEPIKQEMIDLLAQGMEEMDDKVDEAVDAAVDADTARGLAVVAKDQAVAAAASIPTYSSARIAAIEDALGIPHIPPLGSFQDLFGAPDGELRYRTNWTVQVSTTTFNGQLGSLTVSGGLLSGVSGTEAHGYYSAGAGEVWVERVFGSGMADVTSASYLENHISLGSTVGDKYFVRESIGRTVSGGLLAGNYVIQSIIANVVATIGGTSVGQLADLRAEPGDVVCYVEKTVGGTRYINIYMNGVLSSVDIPYPTAVPQTGRCGFNGAIGANTVDEFRIGSTSNANIRLYQPNRVMDIDAGGSGTWYIEGAYTGEPFISMAYSIIDVTTGLALVGHDRQKPTGFVASNGAFSANPVRPDPSLLVAGRYYYLKVHRLGLRDASGNPAESVSRGPLQKFGGCIGQFGQSLGTAASSQTLLTTTTDFAIAPPDSYWQDGMPTLADTRKRRMTMSSQTTVAMCARAIYTATNRPVLRASGGKPSTGTSERMPGSDIYEAMKLAVRRMGRHCVIEDTGGQRGTDNSDPTGYKARMFTIYNTLRQTYPNVTVIVTPIAAVWSSGGGEGGSDSQIQALRRAQWELLTLYPDIFVALGPNTLDLQHLDNLHLTNDSYGEAERRFGHSYNKYKGYSTFDRSGPRFASIQKLNAEQAYLQFYLDAFDSLDMVNSGVNNEHHGGMSFSTSSSFSSLIWPTAHVMDSSVTGVGADRRWGVTLTFPGGSFPGTIYARACYGGNPFNPFAISAVNNNFDTQANKLIGIKAGEPSVGIQPLFQTVGGVPQDYRFAA